MNYGKLAKKFAFNKGLANRITPDDGAELIGKPFAPGKFVKVAAAFDKLKEQIERKWRLDDDEE